MAAKVSKLQEQFLLDAPQREAEGSRWLGNLPRGGHLRQRLHG